MKYLLDANVVSEVRRRRPNAGVLDWTAGTPAGEVALSVLTLAEIEAGVEHLLARGEAEHGRARAIRRWAREDLAGEYAGRVLAVTDPTWVIWSRRMGQAKARGEGQHAIDFLYAAQAEEYGLTLVTRNTAHLASTGVPLLNPFHEEG